MGEVDGVLAARHRNDLSDNLSRVKAPSTNTAVTHLETELPAQYSMDGDGPISIYNRYIARPHRRARSDEDPVAVANSRQHAVASRSHGHGAEARRTGAGPRISAGAVRAAMHTPFIRTETPQPPTLSPSRVGDAVTGAAETQLWLLCGS